MRTLPDVTPTPEQLPIISRNRPGVEIIRGAAGSGKTTTALLRLQALTSSFVSRKRRELIQGPVRVLVITYNRTLRGYIMKLAMRQITETNDVDLQISTFGRSWLTPAEMNDLNILFQNRHLLAHKDGIVDDKYIQKIGDTSYKVGQRIVIKDADVRRLVGLITRLASEIRAVARSS